MAVMQLMTHCSNICSQGRNKVHDKVVHRPVMRMHNLRHVLQHIVYGFDNVPLAQHHSYHYDTKKAIKWIDWLSR